MKALLALLILMSMSAFAKEPFTDKDLHQALSKNESGIIYLWSPFMPLSVIGREEIIEVAQNLNLQLILVVDPLATQTETPDPLMMSRDLMKFGVLDHYPAIALYSEGKLVKDVIIHGYEQKQTLSELINSYLNGKNL